MLTAFLFAAALAAAAPDTSEPPAQPAPAARPASDADASHGLEALGSLSEDDLATEAAQVVGHTDDESLTPAQGGAQLAQQPSVALDRSRIENFTPPPPEPVAAAPSLGGFGFAAAFGR